MRFVARLPGGQHAVITLVSGGHHEYVVRRFPPADDAVAGEVQVPCRLGAPGELVPQLVGVDPDPDGPLIVTTRVPGTAPDPPLSPDRPAPGLARVLDRIHDQDGSGLRLTREPFVLGHSDFWCGYALWDDDVVTGVTDWSGGRNAPRGFDVAWCRLDLALPGSHDAAALLSRSASVPRGQPSTPWRGTVRHLDRAPSRYVSAGTIADHTASRMSVVGPS